MKTVLDAWGKNYDLLLDALTKKPETDYAREKMDRLMRKICRDTGDFFPFKGRYKWLPEISYEKRK